MKKVYRISCILLCAVVFLMGCGESEEEKQKRLDEENARILLEHKLWVVYDFCFSDSRVVDWYFTGKKKYKKITLYASEEEAAKDHNVSEKEEVDTEAYVYPTEWTYKRLDALNRGLRRDKAEDKVGKYNLEYPIELEDIINQTEDIWQLLHDREILSEDNYNIMLSNFAR